MPERTASLRGATWDMSLEHAGAALCACDADDRLVLRNARHVYFFPEVASILRLQHPNAGAVSHAFGKDCLCLCLYLCVYLPNVGAVSPYESLGFVASGTEPEALRIGNRCVDPP